MKPDDFGRCVEVNGCGEGVEVSGGFVSGIA